MADILRVLVNASERAAAVAKSCCAGSPDETLLVAEKGEGEANTRFDKDFKTIADVVAQEAAKREISLSFPDIASYVRGEESAEVGGIPIELGDNAERTIELLTSFMLPAAAKRMSEAVHGEILINPECEWPTDLPLISSAELGVWIDPIDATAEFIAGVRGEADENSGLPCVTVLIGAYNRSTGEPIIGVVNQPFSKCGKGRIIWGVNYGDTKRWGGCVVENNTEYKTVVMSSSESPEISEKFKVAGWEVKPLPGAGHKLMKVASGEAAAYIVSKGTTFLWDTCAPHAILCAKGGGLLCYTNHTPIKYNIRRNLPTQQYANDGGIIAYGHESVLDEINQILK